MARILQKVATGAPLDHPPSFLAGGGEMGAHMRAHDWSATPLGPAAGWPQPLRTAVRLLLNTQHPVFVFWGPTLACFYNDAYSHSIGPERHPGALGRPGREVWAEIWDTIAPQIEQVMSGGGATWHENHLVPITRRGRREDVFWTYSYSPNDDEAAATGVGGVLVICNETTAQVVAEQRLAATNTERERIAAELLAQKAQLEAVIETVPAAVWFTHDRDARHVTGNRQAAELLRFPRTDNHSMSARNNEGPEGFRVVRNGIDIPAEQLPMQRAARGEEVATEECDLVFQDGSSATILVRATPMRDHAGQTIGAVCTAIDITERKRAEAVLRRSEEEFRWLGEDQPNLCWMADAKGWIYWYNKRWYDYTGTTLADMQGWGWQSVHDPAVLPQVMQSWSAALVAGAAFEMTFPLRGADGTFRPFLTRIVPVRGDDGTITRWFGSNVDISAHQATESALRASQDALRQLNEQLEARVAAEVAAREQVQQMLAQAQRMEALGQLAGGIAHDFNNVLQAVSGGLSLIQKRAGDAEVVRQLARMAGDAALRGGAITGRLLAFARRGELQAVAVSPVSLLESLQEILVSTLGGAITVRIDVRPELPPLLADKAQLETVLVNLAVNARDAMPDGGHLTIAARCETITVGQAHPAQLLGGVYVRLDLTDTGIGMDAATLKRALEPFFTTKPIGQGTGLGLAMARGFAQQSGGGLSLRSSSGRGTTVTLWFPRAEHSAIDGPEPTTPTVAPGARPAKALVVDDDAMVREVLAHQFTALGFIVSQATDGLDALARLDAGEPADLLVTDLSMPGMNGLLLIEEARRRLPGLPAMLLTGYADADVDFDRNGGWDGATIVVRKPVSDDDLAQTAATLLDPRVPASISRVAAAARTTGGGSAMA